MPSPYRQQRGDTAIKGFGKSIGKRVLLEGVKKVSPTAGKIASAMEQIEAASSNPGNYLLKTGLSKGFGAAGGGLATILMNPTEIANDPMEGAYGAMLDNERLYQNSAIDRGEQMGPPVPSEDIRRIVDAEIDAPRIAKAKREAYANSNQKPGFNFATLAGLLSSPYVGIR